MVFQPLPPAPHRPVCHPDDLGSVPPGNLFSHRLQQNILQFHHPLRFRSGVLPCARQPSASPAAFQSGHFMCEYDRTNHILATVMLPYPFDLSESCAIVCDVLSMEARVLIPVIGILLFAIFLVITVIATAMNG